MTRVLVSALAGAVVFTALGGSAPARRQTFPGSNGPLVFGIGATLVTANVDGSNRKTVVPTQSNFSAYEPAWSADGTKIAFANKQGGTGGIMYVNADGTGITRVTSDVNDGEPTWSPDGTKLAYIHVSTGRRRLVISNLDGSGLTVVTPTLERTLDDPEWSPDGSRLAFSDFADIWVVNVDGSNLRNLTSGSNEPARADNPSWSPDGTRIAYTYAITSVKTVAPDGTGSTTVVANLGEVWEISWSPDGTKIAMANDARGPLQEELFVVNADGSGLTNPGVDLGTTLDWGKAAAVTPPPAVAPPVVGVNVNVTPVSGVVRVRLPGTASFVDLAALQSVPVGAEVDATRGRVRLVSAAGGSVRQTADFYQGRAVVSQSRGAPLTTLTLSEPLTCPKRKTSAAGAKKVRRLWGNGKGLFVTKGRYASATVRGTVWLTEDRCTSTLIRVRAGRVQVFDRRLGRRVTIRAGQSYVARAR
jgi:dipeptidyl aminopeptidase/acylaminoacyl peptidase